MKKIIFNLLLFVGLVFTVIIQNSCNKVEKYPEKIVGCWSYSCNLSSFMSGCYKTTYDFSKDGIYCKYESEDGQNYSCDKSVIIDGPFEYILSKDTIFIFDTLNYESSVIHTLIIDKLNNKTLKASRLLDNGEFKSSWDFYRCDNCDL